MIAQGNRESTVRSDDKCWKMLLFNYSISFDSHCTSVLRGVSLDDKHQVVRPPG